MEYADKQLEGLNISSDSTLGRKYRSNFIEWELNYEAFIKLETTDERILYLAKRGWRLQYQKRGNNVYCYAVKYIKRKKCSIYMGRMELKIKNPSQSVLKDHTGF